MAEIAGTRLDILRKRAGLSRNALAQMVGVSQPTISRLITGETKHTSVLMELAQALGTSPEYLTGESDDPRPTMLAERQRGFRHKEPARDADLVYVAEIDLRFGLGASVMDQEIVEHQAEKLPFPRAWLRHITSSSPDQLYWAQARGNSMEPNISSGDVVLIDRSQTDGLGDLYWAISYGQSGMIKRLRPLPDGSIKILSDNPGVEHETAYDGELSIFGRVVAIVRKV